MRSLPGFIKVLQYLSIDVVAGSLCCAGLALTLTHTAPPALWWICLALAVWVIYTTDHLIDSRNKRENTENPRHAFHYKNRTVIIICLIISILICCTIALFSFDFKQIMLGLIIGAVALLYLILIWWNRGRLRMILQKEMLVALIYTSGIWFVPVQMVDFNLAYGQWICIVIFFILAWVDGLVIANYEINYDESDQQTSLPRLIGSAKVWIISNLLLLFTIALSICVLLFQPDFAMILSLLVFIAMSAMLLLVIRFKEYFSVNERYKTYSELVFIIPIVVLIYSVQ